MNKADFVNFIAENMEVTKADAERFLEVFVQGVHDNVCNEEIRLSGLGTFARVKRKARVARNPQTGKEIKIPAKWSPKFKAGAELKKIVQSKK